MARASRFLRGGARRRIRRRRTDRHSDQHAWRAGGRHLGVQPRATSASSCRTSTRAHTRCISFRKIGDVLRTNRRRPILTLIEDTSGGVHDTLIAACDRYRYAFLGRRGPSRQLHRQSVRRHGGARARAAGSAEPAQSFHEHSMGGGRHARLRGAAQAVPGGYVRLRAEMDLVIAFSACPQDILPINGTPGKTVEAHFTIS